MHIACFFAVGLLLQQLRLSSTYRTKRITHTREQQWEVLRPKQGYGDNATFQFSFQAGIGRQGNNVGRVMVKFVGEQATLTNQGFARYPPSGWFDGMLLGKADEYVWPIGADGSGGHPGAMGAPMGFTFDHGASDLVFGDSTTASRQNYRPEFEEIIYTRTGGAQPGFGAGFNSGSTYDSYFESPQQALAKQLAEEQKESELKLGTWHPDGYFLDRAPVGGGSNGMYQQYQHGGQGTVQMQYTPRLKLKSSGESQTGFQQINRQSLYSKASLERPHIMDIDNLFAAKPLVPNSFRHTTVVAQDHTYQGGFNHGGYHPGGYNPAQPNGYTQPGYNQPGYNQPGYDQAGYNQPGYNQPGYNGQSGYNQPGYNGQSGHNQPGYNGQPQPGYQSQQGYQNRPQPGYQPQPGYNSNANYGYGNSYLQSESNTSDTVESHAGIAPLPVEISVQWLTPVLQKFQCVSVAAQYAKVGASALYIAMGWDTESGISDLDLDLSLVPITKNKLVIQPKMVWYSQKNPDAMRCGGGGGYGYHGNLGMKAFNDDRTGDEPGDDELVKVDLGCITQFHQDIDAIVVMVNVYTPQMLQWNQIDSAYLRIISGGQEMQQSGNFFVTNAEAVRSFVRLSGNDLKADPELQNNGLAVGMFFRQPRGDWAFATLMKGLRGRNVMESGQALQDMLQDLVYPANENWDRTKEQQELAKNGAFGFAGMHGKAVVTDQIASGQLPCVASRKDQANILLGRMTDEALQKVTTAPNVRNDVKKTAEVLLKNDKVREKLQITAQTETKMEKADTEEERKEIAVQAQQEKPVAPTQEQSDEAAAELEDLFDML